ncbi:hypothetical protein, partial [Fulvivirga lutimaris]|uniref:tyrosine-protein kinase family protein n=1 Tax=Fulvivirga lutimaris TaxID=1819566 RepID=UPI0016241ED1
TKYNNIDVIGSITSPLSPSELLYEKDFKTLIDGLSDHYDYIFLESAALNEYSDTKELLNYVDQVIPVFSAQNDIKQNDKESIEYFKNLNGKLFGAVLNRMNLKDMEI